MHVFQLKRCCYHQLDISPKDIATPHSTAMLMLTCPTPLAAKKIRVVGIGVHIMQN